MTALILASGSSIRRKMLEDAGVEFEVVRPDINESTIKEGHPNLDSVAKSLAEAKALSVSVQRPDAWVIGSDSVISVDDALFSKPRDREEAAQHLRTFSGKTMQLVSAVAMARSGEVDWSHVGQAVLEVRELSEQFIEAYLDAEWPEVGETVGVFRMEGRGIQLFHSLLGGHFTVLGMPLLPVLKRLRKHGLLLA